ncbi:MAG TPA: UDP-glucose 4-epimerase, partial [Candidatus Binatia bacterium]|nr:UDP-glucose 4-epimerase [Candidatus Binatia bacterium]
VETDVVTIYQCLRDAIGSTAAAQHGPAKPGEQRRSSLDTTCAGQVLGWRARVTLKDGLQKTAAHYRATVSR